MTDEGEAQRIREERRKELIEHLNREEQPPTKDEIKERQRRATSLAPNQKQVWIFLAAFSLIAIVFGWTAGRELREWLPWPIGLWGGALLAYAAFRYVAWGKFVARFVWTASLAGLVVVLFGIPLLFGDPVFPSPASSGVAYGLVQGFLLG
jgi:uncharacterized MAPEG superfamily protein